MTALGKALCGRTGRRGVLHKACYAIADRDLPTTGGRVGDLSTQP